MEGWVRDPQVQVIARVLSQDDVVAAILAKLDNGRDAHVVAELLNFWPPHLPRPRLLFHRIALVLWLCDRVELADLEDELLKAIQGLVEWLAGTMLPLCVRSYPLSFQSTLKMCIAARSSSNGSSCWPPVGASGSTARRIASGSRWRWRSRPRGGRELVSLV
ncbi:hypothetical protein C8F01DRAFT_1176097 [Mycena amicta]|nr:hypothetical protein C8F01DRAFT_1176097 [Mycena amicta]